MYPMAWQTAEELNDAPLIADGFGLSNGPFQPGTSLGIDMNVTFLSSVSWSTISVLVLWGSAGGQGGSPVATVALQKLQP